MKVMLKGQMVHVFDKEKSGYGSVKVSFTVADRIKKAKDSDETCFIKCIAYGKVADIILDDFSDKNEKGKLISKKIDLYGDLSFYMTDKVVEVTDVLKAKDVFDTFNYTLDEEDVDAGIDIVLNTKIKVAQAILYVKDIEYVDSAKKYSKAREDLEKELGVKSLKRVSTTHEDDDEDDDDE